MATRIGRILARGLLGSMAAVAVSILPLMGPSAAPAPPTWTSQTSGATPDLESVSFVDCTNGWAVGGVQGTTPDSGFVASQATIIHTNDGGATWSPQTSGVTVKLDKVIFVDKLYGWASGDNGTIIHTVDGGLTWTAPQGTTAISTSGVDGIWFVDRLHGWAAANKIFGTTDGGLNWTLQYPLTGGDLTFDAEGMHAVDTTHAWAIGENNQDSNIATTTDGVQWTVQRKPDNSVWTPVTLAGVFFLTPTRGWIVGHNDTVLFTDDGGTTYSTQRGGVLETELPSDYEVRFVSSSQGWVAGGDTTILTTTNSGSNWTAETTDIPTNTTVDFEGLSFPNQTRGWAVGSGGAVLTRQIGPATVESITPSSGPEAGGTQVVIKGCGFTGATGVKFGSTDAAAFRVDSDLQITATTPPGTGTQDTTVTTPAGSSVLAANDQFTYIAAAPSPSPSPSTSPSPSPPKVLPKSGSAAYGTGADLLPSILVVLVCGGVALVAIGRRRGCVS